MTAAPKSWRDVLPIHPAAEMFPLLSKDELIELGKDIQANELKNSIVLWSPTEASGKIYVLDGRNRLDAMEAVGMPVLEDNWKGGGIHQINKSIVRWIQLYGESNQHSITGYALKADPYAFVISANAHRRHLTPEQKRTLIETLLKATPERSDRQIAKVAKVSHHTVAKARKDTEATGQIAQLTKRIGADGKARKQPATKPAPLPAPTVEAIKADIKARVLKVLGLSDATLARIDAWSVRQDDTPDRAAAICRLVEIALNATEPRGTSKSAVERTPPPELAPIDDYPDLPPGLARAPKPTTH